MSEDEPAPLQRNARNGVVHHITCPVIGRSLYLTPYDPADDAHADDRACATCLPNGLPT